MSESIRTPEEVTVIFHQDESLFVPEETLKREARAERETYERAAHRLAMGQGVVSHVEYALPTGDIEDAPRTYVMQPRTGSITVVGEVVHRDSILDHIENHPTLSRIDAELYRRAINLLWGFPESGQTA